MIRVPSPLDAQTEKYVKETRDCGFSRVFCFGISSRLRGLRAFAFDLLFVCLNLLPLRLHFIQRRGVERAAGGLEVLFHPIESLRELLVRLSQRRFRFDSQPP